MPSNEKNDDGSYQEVAELNPSDDDESCKLWRLKNEQDYELYRRELNTRSALEAEAQIKLFVDDAITSPQKIAAVGLDPVVRAAITQTEYADTFTADLPIMVAQLRSRCDKLSPKKMLLAQATTLDSMFHHLAIRAASVGLNTNTTKAEQLMRMAFRAQSQCTRTLQVLLMAQEIEKKPTQILVNKYVRNSDGSTQMDSGTTTSSIESNTAMATLVCIDGKKI